MNLGYLLPINSVGLLEWTGQKRDLNSSSYLGAQQGRFRDTPEILGARFCHFKFCCPTVQGIQETRPVWLTSSFIPAQHCNKILNLKDLQFQQSCPFSQFKCICKNMQKHIKMKHVYCPIKQSTLKWKYIVHRFFSNSNAV